MLTHPILHCELFSRASERLIAVMWHFSSFTAPIQDFFKIGQELWYQKKLD